MSKRRLAQEILSNRVSSRKPDTGATKKVVEECGWAKFTDSVGLTDYDPLVTVMHLVTREVRKLGLSPKGPKGSQVWREAMEILQRDTGILEHNKLIPCRTCDEAYEPVVDDTLLRLFLAMEKSCTPKNLISIHRCPACGGQIAAKSTKKYEGDMHTPSPGSVEDDLEWANTLMRHCSFL